MRHKDNPSAAQSGGLLGVGRAAESLSTHECSNLKRVFKAIDFNGDNAICPRDFHRALMHKDIPISKKEVEEIIWECDDLGAGSLDFDAFCRIYAQAKTNKNEPKRLFSFVLYSLFDKDDDGDVTPEELFSWAIPQMDQSVISTLVNSLPRDVDGSGVQAQQFIRLMQSSAWKQKIGDGEDEVEAEPPPKPVMVFKRLDAKKIYDQQTQLFRMNRLEIEHGKQKPVTSSTMRAERAQALMQAQWSPIKKQTKTQRPGKTFAPKQREAAKPKAPQRPRSAERKTFELVDYRNFFSEENCTDEATRKLRAAARQVGVNVNVAEKAHALFNTIDSDKSGTLERNEFMRYMQVELFDNTATPEQLQQCWVHVRQWKTPLGRPKTVDRVTFPIFLEWYSKHVDSDGRKIRTSSEEMYAALGKNRLKAATGSS